MAFRKAILGVSATGAVAGGVVLGKVGMEGTLTGRIVIARFLATSSPLLRAVSLRLQNQGNLPPF